MERKQIKISEILRDLEMGLKRSDIKEKYKLSFSEMKTLFNHPKLKGRKAHKVAIEIIDDTTTDTIIDDAETTENEFQELLEEVKKDSKEFYNELVERAEVVENQSESQEVEVEEVSETENENLF